MFWYSHLLLLSFFYFNITLASEEVGTCANVDGSSESCQADEIDDECQDMNDSCAFWAKQGECNANPEYMLVSCAKSCDSCPNGGIPRQETATMGVRQILEHVKSGSTRPEVEKLLDDAHAYMDELKETKEESFWKPCRLMHDRCSVWAATGECEANPTFMQMQCAPVCKSCHMIRENRCQITPDMPVVWQPGDLNRMFERITSNNTDLPYPVEVLSSPATDGPWVVVIDNVITPEEAQKIIQVGESIGYQESTQVKGVDEDGGITSYKSTHRTSRNSWCKEACVDHPTVMNVTERLSDLTGIPSNNSEYWQLLKYQPQQYYHQHHDYIIQELDRPQGTRILTLLFYLNDVEEGGGTKFNKLDLTVEPKLGRAVLWPNVMDDAPQIEDSRTEHEALPVIKGLKYGANAWYHYRDFKTPHINGCQ